MDDQSRLIIAEAATDAVTTPARRRLFSRRKATPPPPSACENCGAALAGAYCSQCGQHVVDYRRSLGRFFGDVLDSFLNWDSKFFATIALLMTRPWRLTLDFLSGKRVRYVHPLRLYLLISVAFFFGVHELAKQANLHPSESKPLTAEERAKLEASLPSLPPNAQAKVRAQLSRRQLGDPDFEFTDSDKKAKGFEKWLGERLKAKVGEHGVNAKGFFLALVSNLPAMMLCCIPLFAFVLKLLYAFRRIYYIDHLIYALHIHAFAYLAILTIGFAGIELPKILPRSWGLPFAGLIVAAVIMLLLSVRKIYRQGWIVSVLKFAIGGAVYFIVLSLALGATFFVTLALPD